MTEVRPREFVSYARALYPELLPTEPQFLSKSGTVQNEYVRKLTQNMISHSTTIITACYDAGVILLGDRRATSANMRIGRNPVDKIYQIDTHAAIGYAGTLATCMQMAKVIRIAQNNYRKMNGCKLSLEGTAAYVGQLVVRNLSNALEGLVFMPLLVGYEDGIGVIHSYDIAGALHTTHDYAAEGSGADHAISVFDREWTEKLNMDDALRLVLDGLQTAARKDAATGGIKKGRNRTLPLVYTISKEGVKSVDDTVLVRIGGELFE